MTGPLLSPAPGVTCLGCDDGALRLGRSPLYVCLGCGQVGPLNLPPAVTAGDGR